MNRLRKTLTVITSVLAVICFLAESYFIIKYTKNAFASFKNKVTSRPEGAIIETAFTNRTLMYLILISTVLTVLFVLLAAFLAGAPKRKSARTGGIFGLILPLLGVLFNYYRVSMLHSTRITAKALKNVFFENGGWFWIVITVLIAAVGIIAVIFSEQRDFSQRGSAAKNKKIRDGLLGKLNFAGYEVEDVLVTRDDGKDVIILFFSSQEKLENAIENGELEEIKKECQRYVPGYDVRFDADL